MTGPATAPPAPLSLVDLAHAAEQAIARYVDAADKACASVGANLIGWDDLCQARLSAEHALAALVVAAGKSPAREPLRQMLGLIITGIVRPEWGLRVVQIATAEQARRAAHA